MRLKQIIIIIIVIIALAGAGIFAYLGFMSDSNAVIAPEDAATKNSVLPHGTSLNFDKVNKFNETGRQFQYPVVTPAETGLQLNEIMQQ